jgi:hypothetical protein
MSILTACALTFVVLAVITIAAAGVVGLLVWGTRRVEASAAAETAVQPHEHPVYYRRASTAVYRADCAQCRYNLAHPLDLTGREA